MPCSAASLRTAGESLCLSPPSATSGGGAAAGAGALPPAGSGGASVCATPASFGFGWVAAPAAAAPVSICAMTAPTRTVSPSLTAIFTSLPSNGEGISALTLSVTTSTSGSSRLTKSPSCLSHLSTVASVTDSPSWGILICDTPMTASVPEGHPRAERSARGSGSVAALDGNHDLAAATLGDGLERFAGLLQSEGANSRTLDLARES